MSAWTGTAKPSAKMIIRSFLITSFIPPKNSDLGNGKMWKMSGSRIFFAFFVRLRWKLSGRGFRVVMEIEFTRVAFI